MDQQLENVLIKIQAELPSMSNVSRKIGEYILDNQEEIPYLTVSDLAKKSKVSEASISRFSQQLGYDNFREMKMQLLQAPTDSNTLLSEISPTDTANELKDKLQMRIQHALSTTNEALEDRILDNVAAAIAEVDLVQVYGIGASSLVADDLYQKFNRIGKIVDNPSDTHQLVTNMVGFTGKQLLVLISESGLTKDIIKLAEIANEVEVKLVVLTSNKDGKLADLANMVVPTNGKSHSSQIRTAATTSLISQLYVVDLIFYRYLQTHLDQDVQSIKKSYQWVNEYFK